LIGNIIQSRIPSGPPQQMSCTTSSLLSLITFVTERHRSEPATIVLSGDHYIVGDIHGNVDILIRIFEHCGYPPESRYLFLGDYIDRGSNSCEVVLILYALKMLYPDNVHLLRGNHEFFAMSDAYGFRRECESRMTRQLYERIIDSFDSLPIAARIGGNYCVHGGISPRLRTEEAILGIEKVRQFEDFLDSPSLDMLWSDPNIAITEFDKSPRGCGVLFGPEAVKNFLNQCPGTFRVIRSHERCSAGFDWPFRKDGTVLTVFSSCDYCDTMNDAGVAAVTDHDQSAECVRLSPLLPLELGKRRVIFPEWLINEEMIEVPQVDDEVLDVEIVV
jgi:diadenosine tetraphosphatase ApaH/serine/threonine PP2A family protein phosphatase